MRRKRFVAERLENRCLLAAIAFSSQFAARDIVNDFVTLAVADVDGTGLDDTILASSGNGLLSWIDETGQVHTVAASLGTVRSLTPADVNGDGYMDLAYLIGAGSPGQGIIVWQENIDGNGAFGTPAIIANRLNVSALSVADIDGDGDQDLVANESLETLSWFENVDGHGETFLSRNIWTGVVVNAIASGDIDRDGDVDIVVASFSGTIWLDNIGGNGASWSANVIDPAISDHVMIGDVDGNAALDIVANPGWQAYTWFRNEVGEGRGFSANALLPVSETTRAVQVALQDVDGDGHTDVVAAIVDDDGGAQKQSLGWYANVDGDGAFADFRLIDNVSEVTSLAVSDRDHNGTADIIIATWQPTSVLYYSNGGPDIGFRRPVVVSEQSTYELRSISMADLDGDRFMDIISNSGRYSDHRIAWYQNMRDGTFGPQKVVSTEIIGPWQTTEVDLDRDGDLDLVVGSVGDNFDTCCQRPGQVAWFENVDGKGEFGARNVIDDRGIMMTSVTHLDLDGDGDEDIIAGGDQISWYENIGSRFIVHDVVTRSAGLRSISQIAAVDVDGDSLPDVVLFDPRGSYWMRNLGHGNVGPLTIVDNSLRGGLSCATIDVDGDGAIDVVAAYDGAVVWYKNDPNMPSHFGVARFITENSARFWMPITPADVDGDGRIDLVMQRQAEVVTAIEIAWLENLGDGDFVAARPLPTGLISSPLIRTMLAVDVDRDGRTDIVLAANEIAWLGNRVLGDANHDGVFDSTDLVLVFQVGEYEDEIQRNSTYSEGDWDGDGEFDSGDLVLAFQSGGYADAGLPAHDEVFAEIGTAVKKTKAFVV